jgi:hypothetical protein
VFYALVDYDEGISFMGGVDMKKVASFIFVSIFAALSLSIPVNASSEFDNIVEVAEGLHLSRDGLSQGFPECSPVDVTSNWMDILNEDSSWWSGSQFVGGTSREDTQENFLNALNGDGGISVSQIEYEDGSTTGTGVQSIADAVRIVFSPSSTAYVDFMIYGGQKYAAMRTTDNEPVYAVILQFHDPDAGSSSNACTPLITQSVRELGTNSIFLENRGIAAHPTDDTYGANPLFVDVPVVYPSGYEGAIIPGIDAWSDMDGDNLTIGQELTQGTSNANKDTDSDGLNDNIESQWYPNRQVIFCDTDCAYPNPAQKDIYVEIDWMKNSSNQVFKPTSSQLALVEDMYADEGINFHADIGQFGGGNELAVYTHSLSRVVTSGQVDFWDYKNGGDGIAANFSSDRNLIWRYMIYGYEYASSSGTSSGWSEVMGDDIFVSGGWINSLPGLASLDRAIANTIAHETGHALCLSSVQVFVEQPAGCIYDGVDNDDPNDAEYNLANYKSVMNYRYQLTDQDDMGVVHYSDGSHGTGDHDDWSGVLTGMGRFTGTKTALGAIANDERYFVTPDGGIAVQEAPIGNVSKEKKPEDPAKVLQGDVNGQQQTGSTMRYAGADGMPKVKQAVMQNDWVSSSVMALSSVAATGLVAIGVILARRKRS